MTVMKPGDTIFTLSPIDPTEPVQDDGRFDSRYEPGELLGQGGMGDVRLFTDRRIGRDVAVKLIRPGLAQRPDLLARFMREVRVQGQLEHPSVVPVYDLELRPPTTAFTMKRVRGVTLEAVIDSLRAGDAATSAAYSRRKLLGILQQVCLAIEFAHARGVVHRDLKPANIMVGDFGEVYVLDWGIAKVGHAPDVGADPITEPDASPPAMTAVGFVLGTPGYMAPEQMAGDPVSPCSDVYALGALLFEILTFEPLHSGTREEVQASTLRDATVTASRRAPDRDIPPELDAVCARATARHPADRFSSARELHDALERYLDGDRDLAQRRLLAETHAKEALEGLRRSMAEGSAEHRAAALREAGRALVLDPTNEDALRAALALRTTEDGAVPEEVEAELTASAREHTRARVRVGGYLYAFLALLTVAVGLLFDVRETAAVVLLLVASAACWIHHKRPEEYRWVAFALVASTAATVLLSRMFAPLLFVFAAVNIAPYFLSNRSWIRRLAVACAVGSLVAPIGLQAAGIFAPIYELSGGGVLIHLRTSSFMSATRALWMTIGSIAVLFGLLAGLLGRFADRLADAQRKLRLQTWRLRQIVPEAMHE